MQEFHPIYIALEASVNLEILNICEKLKKDPTFNPQNELIALNERGFFSPITNNVITLSECFSSHGDTLFYSTQKGKEKGMAAEIFNLLVKVLSLGAFVPGGISFGDLQWKIE